MTGESKGSSKRPAVTGTCNHLQSLVGREIVVPAVKIGLVDTEEPLQGSIVLVSQEESNCLWCTFPGNPKWYCWHVVEVEPWLVQPWQKAVKRALSLPDTRLAKQARKSQQNASTGRTHRAGTTGKPNHTRPQPPGSEHLWKYCKRCNSWKQRPHDFSKNNRTPDGLQFYCRYCHNRMTKFNQARRLEDQHVAQKQMLLSRPPEKSSHKPQSSRHSPKSGASVSAALKQQQAGFDVLASKVPRQPRTHAMYRKESATEALSDDAPGDASNGNNQTQHTGSELEHSAGQIDKPSRQITCSAAKQHSDRVRALPKPALRSQSNPAELMLQANLVLEQLEQVQAKAGDSSQDQSQHHATSSPKHSPAYVAHKTFTCSQRRHSKAAEHGTLSDSVCRAEQPQHDSTPIPQEPTSSSTGYAEVSMPSSPPAAVASKTAPEPQRLASTDKSSSGHVTSPFALPAQQANAQRCELADATTEMGIQQAAKLQAMMPKPAARSSSDAHVDRETSAAPAAACELQEGRTRQASQALQGNAQQGQQPRPDAYGANTPMDNEHATMAVAGGRSPQAAAQPGKAADMLKMTRTQSPSPKASGSKSGARLASVSLLSEGSSRKRQKASVSPTHRSFGSSGMDSLAAAAAAMEAATAEEPTASGAADQTEARESQTQTKQQPELSKELESDLPRSTPAQVPVVPAAVVPAAVVSAAATHVTAAASDSLSTLASLMKAMSPDELQDVLKGLRVSGSSMVPAEVLESMSKQLEAAMAPLPPSAPENPAPFTTFPGPFGQLPSNALFVPSSSPAPLSASAKAPHKKPRAIKAKAGTAHSTAGPPVPNAPGHALQAWGLGGNPLLNSYHAPSLPSTAVIATATATAPLAASKVSTALPTTNAFSWLHSQGLQQPALGSSPVPSGSAPAILSSLAACGNAYRRTFGAHILGTAQDRNQAAGAFPTAALGTASSLGFPQTQGVASTLTAAQTLGAGSAFGAVLGSAPAHAALELTLLLTTLQSLAGSPSQAEGSPVPQTTLTTNCHAATAQLRDWLSQLQHQAMLGTEMSHAQQAQEDAALAAQVRSEMWGNLQGILNMLTSQGCSPHVHDMVHQIAVHFANEQSQSVAVDRRLRNSLNKEKEARRRMQQQLQGSVQVLTALQRVLGSVKMQQQQQQQQQYDHMRSTSLPHLRQASVGISGSGVGPAAFVDAEREQRIAQQQLDWQRKEAAYQAELSLAQTSNAKLHEQVSTLLNASKLQDVTQNSKPGKELCIMQAGTQRLADDLAACKAQRDRLHEQLSIKSANIRHLSQENCKLLVEIKQLQAKGEQARSDQA